MTKKHSKLGNRKGMPAYRTPAVFIYKKNRSSLSQKSGVAKVYKNGLKKGRFD